MRVLRNIAELVTCAAPGAGVADGFQDAALVWDDDRILWVGVEAELPAEYREAEAIDAGRQLLVPGLVDCHTHLGFGGWRADEFEQRSRGAGYLEIARAGGGILRTVSQTRAATDEELLASALERLAAMCRLGVTTVECKSGYGLSTRDEIRLLEVYERAAALQPMRLVPTFLGAHVVPAEYKGRRQVYVDLICDEMIPQVAERKLAVFCDVFVEEGAFTVEEARRIFRVASRHGLQPKLHVDQLSDVRGAALAAEVRAASADHLEYSNREGMARMIERGVVPVALPVASLYLRQKPMDARAWIELGGEVAVATDLNPGSAPTWHLPLAMTLACTMNRMTPREALYGITRVASRAIGKSAEIGSLEPGKKADFVLVDTPSVNHWAYQFTPNQATAVWIGGVPAW